MNHGLPGCLALILFCSLWQGVDRADILIAFNSEDLQYLEDGTRQRCIKVGIDFIRHTYLREKIDEEIQQINAELEDYELIQKYTIINRQFTLLADEVTPTSKLKRRVIAEHFAAEIEAMYR